MPSNLQHSLWRGAQSVISLVVSLLLVHFASQLNLTVAQVVTQFPELANATIGGLLFTLWHYIETKYFPTP